MVSGGIWNPSGINDVKKLAGPAEVTNLSLKTGGASAFVEFYDSADTNSLSLSDRKWVLDASTSVPDNEKLDGLIFKKGVVAKLVQGDNNCYVCIARINYDPNN